MRIAVVSDINGNLNAFEAVLSDLGQTSPDLVLHGGDLVDGGSMPAEIVDRVPELGCPAWAGFAKVNKATKKLEKEQVDFSCRSNQCSRLAYCSSNL